MSERSKAKAVIRLVTHCEAQLVTDLIAGKPGAADVLVKAFTDPMTMTANRILGNPSLAEDCVQDALVSALRNTRKLNKRSCPVTRLRRLAANQALAQLGTTRRRCWKEPSFDQLLLLLRKNVYRAKEIGLDLKPACELFEQGVRQSLIQSEVLKLPQSYRTILELRDIERLTTREVSKRLGISEGNAKVRLHRTRSTLKKKLVPLLRKGAI